MASSFDFDELERLEEKKTGGKPAAEAENEEDEDEATAVLERIFQFRSLYLQISTFKHIHGHICVLAYVKKESWKRYSVQLDMETTSQLQKGGKRAAEDEEEEGEDELFDFESRQTLASEAAPIPTILAV